MENTLTAVKHLRLARNRDGAPVVLLRAHWESEVAPWRPRDRLNSEAFIKPLTQPDNSNTGRAAALGPSVVAAPTHGRGYYYENLSHRPLLTLAGRGGSGQVAASCLFFESSVTLDLL